MNEKFLELLKLLELKSIGECEQARFVLCAESTPTAIRVKNTIEVDCDGKCKKKLLLSPSSPKKPPKLCIQCAIKSLQEEEQQSTAE